MLYRVEELSWFRRRNPARVQSCLYVSEDTLVREDSVLTLEHKIKALSKGSSRT